MLVRMLEMANHFDWKYKEKNIQLASVFFCVWLRFILAGDFSLLVRSSVSTGSDSGNPRNWFHKVCLCLIGNWQGVHHECRPTSPQRTGTWRYQRQDRDFSISTSCGDLFERILEKPLFNKSFKQSLQSLSKHNLNYYILFHILPTKMNDPYFPCKLDIGAF